MNAKTLNQITADIAALRTEIANLANAIAMNRRPNDDPTSFSVLQFCQRNNISRRLFFRLQQEGRAPRVMRIRGRKSIRISREAETDWVRAREADRAAERQAAE